MKRYQVILGATAVVVAFVIMGTIDAEEQERAAAKYCDMVEQGAWGAYREDVSCE